MVVMQVVVVVKVYEMFDVYCSFMVKIIFYEIIVVDGFVDLQNFCVRKFIYMVGCIDIGFFDDFLGEFCVDVVNVLKCDYNVFVCWDVNVSNMCYVCFYVMW